MRTSPARRSSACSTSTPACSKQPSSAVRTTGGVRCPWRSSPCAQGADTTPDAAHRALPRPTGTVQGPQGDHRSSTRSPAIPRARSSSVSSGVENEQTDASPSRIRPIGGGTMRVSGPVTGGSKGWAFGGPVADLAAVGYRQEEYFLEGEAARYGPVPGTDLGWDGRWQVEPVETAPFTTRLVVVRPDDPARLQRDGRRPVEQRLRRVRELRGRRQPGGLRERLRLRRRLRPAGRHPRATRQSAGPARLGSGALRIAVDPQR